MVEVILALIIFALIGYIVYLNEQHQKETQLLLDRIMARNLVEFQQHTVPVKNEKPVEVPPEYTNMQELTDKEWDEIIKQQAGTETTTSKAIKTLKSRVLRK